MTKDVMNAACPCCAAPLRFDGGEGKLKCDSCGNAFEPEVMAQVDEATRQAERADEMRWEGTGERPWGAGEAEALTAYTCPSCGAEIVIDSTTAATGCAYCGNPSILPGRLSGDFRPDAVVPFSKTREDAQGAYKKFIKGKPLLPKLFGLENRVEKIQGVYVPFWMFECDADADLTFRAERKRVHNSGNYIVTDTDHFLVVRGGRIGFSGVPVDGSSKFEDTLMEAIEPFDYGGEKGFSTAYLPGFQAEKYDVDADAARPRADERVRTSAVEAFSATVVDYTSSLLQSASVRLARGSVRNVLLPVWMLNTRYRDKTYTFAMNGQTGKIVGKLPVDRARAAAIGFLLLGGSFLLLLGGAWALFATGVI